MLVTDNCLVSCRKGLEQVKNCKRQSRWPKKMKETGLSSVQWDMNFWCFQKVFSFLIVIILFITTCSNASYIAQVKADKEEKGRAREQIRQKLQQDKVELRFPVLKSLSYCARTRTVIAFKFALFFCHIW